MSSLVISVRGLTKAYGDTAVLKGVDFAVQRGEIFALLAISAVAWFFAARSYRQLA